MNQNLPFQHEAPSDISVFYQHPFAKNIDSEEANSIALLHEYKNLYNNNKTSHADCPTLSNRLSNLMDENFDPAINETTIDDNILKVSLTETDDFESRVEDGSDEMLQLMRSEDHGYWIDLCSSLFSKENNSPSSDPAYPMQDNLAETISVSTLVSPDLKADSNSVNLKTYSQDSNAQLSSKKRCIEQLQQESTKDPYLGTAAFNDELFKYSSSESYMPPRIQSGRVSSYEQEFLKSIMANQNKYISSGSEYPTFSATDSLPSNKAQSQQKKVNQNDSNNKSFADFSFNNEKLVVSGHPSSYPMPMESTLGQTSMQFSKAKYNPSQLNEMMVSKNMTSMENNLLINNNIVNYIKSNTGFSTSNPVNFNVVKSLADINKMTDNLVNSSTFTKDSISALSINTQMTSQITSPVTNISQNRIAGETTYFNNDLPTISSEDNFKVYPLLDDISNMSSLPFSLPAVPPGFRLVITHLPIMPNKEPDTKHITQLIIDNPNTEAIDVTSQLCSSRVATSQVKMGNIDVMNGDRDTRGIKVMNLQNNYSGKLENATQIQHQALPHQPILDKTKGKVSTFTPTISYNLQNANHNFMLENNKNRGMNNNKIPISMHQQIQMNIQQQIKLNTTQNPESKYFADTNVIDTNNQNPLFYKDVHSSSIPTKTGVHQQSSISQLTNQVCNPDIIRNLLANAKSKDVNWSSVFNSNNFPILSNSNTDLKSILNIGQFDDLVAESLIKANILSFMKSEGALGNLEERESAVALSNFNASNYEMLENIEVKSEKDFNGENGITTSEHSKEEMQKSALQFNMDSMSSGGVLQQLKNVGKNDESQPVRKKATRNRLPRKSKVEKIEPDMSGYLFYLEAPTSIMRLKGEDRVTYLNKGQYYSLVMGFLSPNKVLNMNVKSIIMLVLHEKDNEATESRSWQLWSMKQMTCKTRALDIVVDNLIEKENENVINICEVASNAVSVSWNRKSPIKLNIALNCLSTDFSHQKGFMGNPLQIQIDTFEDDSSTVIHRAYCQIKIFCDKGADRKIREEEKRRLKCPDDNKVRQSPCDKSMFYRMADVKSNPFFFHSIQNDNLYIQPSKIDEANSACSSSTFSQSELEDALRLKMPKRHEALPKIVLYIRNENDKVFTALTLEEATMSSFTLALKEKYGWPPDSSISIYHQPLSSQLIKLNDANVTQLRNQSTHLVKINESQRLDRQTMEEIHYDIILTELNMRISN